MKRKIVHHGLKVFVTVLVIFVVLVWVMKAPVMSMILSNKLRVKVKVGRIVMRPSYTKIHNFRIKNPPGYKRRTALNAKKIDVNYQFSHLFDNPREIDQIVIDDVFLAIDFKNLVGSENNWTEILENMPRSDKSANPILIKKLVLNNFVVEIWGRGFNAALKKKVKIPQIILTDINSKDGFPTEQLVAQIFSQAGIKDYLKKLFSPDNILQEIFAPFSLGESEWEQKKGPSLREEPSAIQD